MIINLKILKRTILFLSFGLICNHGILLADELFVGVSSIDITPQLPVALDGQFHLRIAKTIETPLTANVIALESKGINSMGDIAIMVSADVVGIPAEALKKIRELVKDRISGLDVNKIFINAVHTHTAPVLVNSNSWGYAIPKEGVTQPEEYMALFTNRVAEAIVKAWNDRKPGVVSWGLSHAAIAYNRRTVYDDGTAVMYGKTNRPDFMNMEGIEDHDVNILFFWNKSGKLVATAVDVPCTAQEVEGRSAVNADYIHPVRERLKKRFGPDLVVLGWIGAAGDQSPRPLYRQAAEERMIKLRNLERIEEIARRICVAVEEAYETVDQDRYDDIKLVHKVESITLPLRIVTKQECDISRAEFEKADALIKADPKAADQQLARRNWNLNVVERYNSQKTNKNQTTQSEIHVIRLGDIVICTNEFELFTDYGLRIEAQSKALQTFIIQLTGPGTYLPTAKAVKGGGYSAVAQSSLVGPEGGQILVDNTVRIINEIFTPEK